eukprot:1161345-Pelagomonas_calceolata.AAC.25
MPARKITCIRKGSISIKLARIATEGPSALTRHRELRRKPGTELTGVSRVVGHAPGRLDPHSLVSHRIRATRNKKERLCKPGPAACIKEGLPDQQVSQGLTKEAHRPSLS